MGSDGRLGEPLRKGDKFFVSVQCGSREEVDRLFGALGEGGKPIMPAAETLWNAYFGMLVDRYGTGWMFNYEFPKK
jgi:PhnB protein